jgi:hypothetical protein
MSFALEPGITDDERVQSIVDSKYIYAELQITVS